MERIGKSSVLGESRPSGISAVLRSSRGSMSVGQLGCLDEAHVLDILGRVDRMFVIY